MAERVRDLHREWHEAREHPALHRRGEAQQQPRPGAVAHHGLPREGESDAEHRIFSPIMQHVCVHAAWDLALLAHPPEEV